MFEHLESVRGSICKSNKERKNGKVEKHEKIKQVMTEWGWREKEENKKFKIQKMANVEHTVVEARIVCKDRKIWTSTVKGINYILLYFIFFFSPHALFSLVYYFIFSVLYVA